MSKRVKTILITTVSLILVAAILVGALWYFAGKTDPVPVSAVSDHLLGYMGEAPSYQGVVSTNNLQSVYLSGTQKVLEIFVTEGQQVQKGAALFRYDTTLTDIQLERARLASEQAQLKLKSAKAELENIKKMKPYSPPPPTRPTTVPTTAPLDPVDDLPYFISGNGTEERPYRYLWEEYLEFDEDFLMEHLTEQEQEFWIAFEIRERNALAGELRHIWGLHVIAEEIEPEPVETYPTESETQDSTEATESTEATDPTEESSTPIIGNGPEDGNEDQTEEETEAETEETEPEEETPKYQLTYRFFIPEEIDHVERPTVPTTRETEWIDTSSGYTAAEIAVMKQQKELEIRDLDLAARMQKLSYETMKQELSTGIVTATVNGTVVNLRDEATVAANGEPLMQISEGGSYYISMYLGEYDLERYEIGSVATITSWMNYGYTVNGSLVSIADEPTQDAYYSTAGGNSDVSAYEAILVVPPEAKLQEGEWVGLTFHADKSQNKGTLYLENAYIRDENGRSYVYKRNEAGLLEKTYIQVGAVEWGYTAVLSGLTEEDWIAFPYGKDVVDGAQTYEDSGDMYLEDMM